MSDSTNVSIFNKKHPNYLTSDGKSHKLHDTWVLWNHPINSKDWEITGYNKLISVKTVEEFWNLFNDLPTVTTDMWFFMREGIPPRWEDPVNLEGGSFKFRVHESKADNMWYTLSLHLVCEMMCRNIEDSTLITGISISPKRHQNPTVSVWNLDRGQIDRLETKCFPSNIEGVDFRKSMYHAHTDRRCG